MDYGLLRNTPLACLPWMANSNIDFHVQNRVSSSARMLISKLGGGLPANQVARVAGGAIAPILPSLPLPNHLAHRQAHLFFFPHAQSRFAKSDDQSPRHQRHRFAIRIPSSTPHDPPSHVSSRCGFCLGCQTRPRQPHPTYAHPHPHPHPHRPTRGQGCRRRRAGSLHAPSD